MANLKQEVLDKIIATDDENLLQLLKTDIEYFTHEGFADITDSLTNKQLEELAALAGEPDEADTHTMEDFEKATERWHMK